MKNWIVLTESIEYIERNLCEPITRQEIAAHCYVSLSSLEKLFRYALNVSIKSYLLKRRMTQAAKDIVGTGLSVTDIAMKYQFGSAEVFSRAFKRVWRVNPSQFKEKWRFTGIFPRINYEYCEGDDQPMASKRVDMSEAYKFFRERKGSYVLCFDIRDAAAFNRLSRKAGDLAILEMAARLDRAADDTMLVIRIGGDEFALVTGLYDLPRAQGIADAVLSHNGETFRFGDKELPLSLWCGVTKVPESVRYNELFTELHNTIKGSKAPADAAGK